MSRFMSGPECADACTTLANFLDTRRDLSCDGFSIQLPLDATGIAINVDAGYFEPNWDKTCRPDEIYPGGIACKFLLARRPLDENRPYVSAAFLALGSVATSLGVDIFKASGCVLDSTLPISQLKLCIADLGNPDKSGGANKITALLDSREHFRDRDYIPHIITDHRDHKNRPITVELNFYPGI